MTDDLHATTRQLIHDVESKDKKFRVAQIVFNLLVLILLIIAMVYGYNLLKTDQANRDKAAKTIINELDTQVQNQSKELQCIVNFFSQPDRSNLVITDPNKCFTKQVSGSSASPTTQASSPAPSTPTQNTSQTPSNKNDSTDGQGNQSHPLVCNITLKLVGC